MTMKGRRTVRDLGAAAFIAGISALASTAAFANGCPPASSGSASL